MSEREIRFEKMSEDVDIKAEASSSYEAQKISLEQDNKDFVVYEVFHSGIPLMQANSSMNPDNLQEHATFANELPVERETQVKSETPLIKLEPASICMVMDFKEEVSLDPEVGLKSLNSLITPISTSALIKEPVIIPTVKKETEEIFLGTPDEEKSIFVPEVNFIKEEPSPFLHDDTSDDPLGFHIIKDCDIYNEDTIKSEKKKIKTEPVEDEALSGTISSGISKEEDVTENDLVDENSHDYEDCDYKDYDSFEELLTKNSFVVQNSIDREESTFIAHCEDLESSSLRGTGVENKYREDGSCSLHVEGLNTLHKKIKKEETSYEITDDNTEGSDVEMVENKTTSDVVVLSSDDESSNEFACGLCNVKKPNSHDLTVHIDTVHKGIPNTCPCIDCKPTTLVNVKSFFEVSYKPYKCSFCDDSFIRLHDLKKHILKIHSEEDGFSLKCQQCRFVSYTKYEMNDHCGQTHDKFKGYYCIYCNKSIRGSKAKMKMHVLKNHGDSFTFKCCVCDFKSLNVASITNHVQKSHLESAKHFCSICNFSASTKKELGNHLSKNHLECLNTQNICQTCKKEFSTHKSLLLHVRYVCLKDKKKLRCTVCRWPVASLDDLRKHIHLKHRPDVYACTLCSFKTLTKLYLESHMVSTHNNVSTASPSETVNPVNSLSSEFSSSKSNTDNEILLHNRNACEDKVQYSCRKVRECKFTTYSKVELQNHYFENHNQKINCFKCNFTFFSKGALKNHIKKTHNEETKYFCKLCKKYMNDILALQQHWRIFHKKRMPYNCSLCPYKCLTKRRMTIHINAKHSEVDFVDVVH